MIYTLTLRISTEADTPEEAYKDISGAMRDMVRKHGFSEWESERMEDETGQEFDSDDYLAFPK